MRKLAVLALLFLCSCEASMSSSRSTRGYMPELPKPDRPKLSALEGQDADAYGKLPNTTRAAIEENATRLRIYAIQLESTVDTYNGYAKRVNGENDAALGIKRDTPAPKTDDKKGDSK